MILGFVMIQSPEKLLSASHAVEEVIHEELEDSDTNLDNPDISQNVSEKLANGSLSPHEQQHYKLGLEHVQKKGVKGNLLRHCRSCCSCIIRWHCKHIQIGCLYFVIIFDS